MYIGQDQQKQTSLSAGDNINRKIHIYKYYNFTVIYF